MPRFGPKRDSNAPQASPDRRRGRWNRPNSCLCGVAHSNRISTPLGIERAFLAKRETRGDHGARQ